MKFYSVNQIQKLCKADFRTIMRIVKTLNLELPKVGRTYAISEEIAQEIIQKHKLIAKPRKKSTEGQS